MTSEQKPAKRDAFSAEWQRRFPGTLPIKYMLNGRRFRGCWMRIHSLPLSKRYADTPAERDVILNRQNTLIDHLVHQHTNIQIVINWIEPDSLLFKAFELVPLGIFQEADGEPEYDSFLIETVWQSGGLDTLLMMIADENVRGFIIAPDCLILPYDGGVDVIVKDTAKCLALKERFRDWLSLRPDGL
jgi:hypothetical protein